MKKILIIAGARPNFVKIAPLFAELSKLQVLKPLIVHTGQHYDFKMSELFFRELNIPKPAFFLNVGSDTHARQVAHIMTAFEEVCLQEKPVAIIVVGDVNSTLACALVAVKLAIKIIHVEAGLRSFDRSMPEEINRLITDSISDILLTPSGDANKNLINEGVNKKKIFLSGNIMIDTLFKYRKIAEKSEIIKKLSLKNKRYILLTIHRPDNVDGKTSLKRLLEELNILASTYTIVFPVHPRTADCINRFRLRDLLKNMICTDPMGYLDFQKLMMNASLVITDSGGIQEETTALKIPCITVRPNTERPSTVTIGSNCVIGNNMKLLNELTNKAMNNLWKKSSIPELWDGKTAARMARIISKNI
jgi:UDP-N-acetylglucosamine 2-epimerase (non-hydrolysing)